MAAIHSVLINFRVISHEEHSLVSNLRPPLPPYPSIQVSVTHGGHSRCFEAANLLRVTWAVMSLKWIGLSISQYQLELANHRQWFSSFNKSERVKIAHYLVRNLAGSWSQDKRKHCPFAPLRLPNPPHSTSLKKHVVAIDFYIPAQKHTHIKTFVSLITVFIDKFNFQRFVLHSIYSYFYF